MPSGIGYALVRSGDAIGIGIGALIGTLAAVAGALLGLRGQAICMASVLLLISINPLRANIQTLDKVQIVSNRSLVRATEACLGSCHSCLCLGEHRGDWNSLLAAKRAALDLVRGGLEHPD